MTSSTRSFAALEWSDVDAMNIPTQNALAKHFLAARDWERLGAVAGSLGLLNAPRTTGSGPSLDLDLAASGLLDFPLERLGDWMELIQGAAKKASSGIPSGWPGAIDFGSVFSFWCLRAFQALGRGDEPAARAWSARASALAESTLPCSQALEASSNRVTFGRHAFGVDALPDHLVGQTLRSSGYHNEWQPPSAALLLASVGDQAPLAALLARPDRQQTLALAFAADRPDGERRELPQLSMLSSAVFWREHSDLAALIMQAAKTACAGHLSFAPLSVAQACWGGVGDNVDSPAFACARQAFGADVFSVFVQCGPADALRQAGAFAEKDPTLLGAFSRLCFVLAHPHRSIEDQRRWGLLHAALFDPRAELAHAAGAALTQAAPQRNPWLEAPVHLRSFSTHLARAASCADPALALRGWQTCDLDELLNFPPGRVGLDPSAAMLVARNSTPEVFGSFLDWLARRGGADALRSQAAAKAWVDESGSARKKGDLLAFCVAQGKTEHARELLARLPGLDTRYAREAAKTLAAKSNGPLAAGSKALSAWEDLLLGGDLDAAPKKTLPPEPAAEPAPRRAARL
jgi:hypothetical protein